MDFKYKIADVAKEFGMPAKKVVETVSGVTGEAYKTAGTFEEKELNVLLETLTRRAVSLSRVLHVHAEATVGRSRDAGNALSNERQASLPLDDEDDLIPRLRIVR